MKRKIASLIVLLGSLLAISFCFTFNSSAADKKETILNSSAVWKYLDTNEDPANGLSSLSAWTLPEYDDSSWKTGSGSFGSKNGALGSIGSCGTPTQLIDLYKSGSEEVIPTYFFRTSFEIDDASKINALDFSLCADDAVIVYLNGKALFDSCKSQPSAAKTTNMYYAEYTAAVQNVRVEKAKINGALKDGKNTLAVELHNNQKASSDIYFRMDEVSAVYEIEYTTAAFDVVLAPGSNEGERGLTWLSPFPEIGEVQYAPVGSDRSTFPGKYKTAPSISKAATNKLGYYSNKATLTGIEKNTEYVYRIVASGYTSKLYYFTVGNSDNYEFVFVGDPQFDSEKYSLEWIDTLEKIDENFNAEFIISAGDQINTASDEDQYSLFIVPELSEVPFAPTVGPNHDDPSESFGDHFYTPNLSSDYGVTVSSADYWYRYGDALFMHLNMADKTALESEHKQFITEAMNLNADAKWNIVVMHNSLYSAGSHSDPNYKYYETEIKKYRETLAPQLSELGIDLVLGGHDHVYVRSYMMMGTEVYTQDTVTNNTVSDPKGTLYISASSSTGSKFYDSTLPDAYYSAFQNDERRKSAIHFSISDEKIVMNAYFLDTMEVFDSFTIFKSEHIHTMEKIEAKPATCYDNGNNEYWYCNGCNRYFENEEGSRATTPEQEIITKREHVYNAATCTEPATCKYEDCQGTYGESRGHRFSKPTCTEPATCKRDGCDEIGEAPLGHIDEDGNGRCDECRKQMEAPAPENPSDTPTDEPSDEPTDTPNDEPTNEPINTPSNSGDNSNNDSEGLSTGVIVAIAISCSVFLAIAGGVIFIIIRKNRSH